MNGANVKTFDASQVSIIFCAVPLTGLADGTFITVTPGGERYSKGVGADGEVGRSKSNDNTHEVALVLMQTSASNDYLSSKLRADKLNNTGAGPLQIVDKNGTTILFWQTAWIRQPPDWEGAKELSDRTWTFDTAQIVEENYGGNSQVSL